MNSCSITKGDRVCTLDKGMHLLHVDVDGTWWAMDGSEFDPPIGE